MLAPTGADFTVGAAIGRPLLTQVKFEFMLQRIALQVLYR